MSRTAVLALAVTLTVAYPVAASSQSLHATPAVSVAGDGAIASGGIRHSESPGEVGWAASSGAGAPWRPLRCPSCSSS